MDTTGGVGKRFVGLRAAVTSFGIHHREDPAIREGEVEADDFAGTKAAADEILRPAVLDI